MTTVGGIQGSYHGKSYGILYGDMMATDAVTFKRYISKKLFAFPESGYGFGDAGRELTHRIRAINDYAQLRMIRDTMMRRSAFYPSLPRDLEMPDFPINIYIAGALYSKLLTLNLKSGEKKVDGMDMICRQFAEWSDENLPSDVELSPKEIYEHSYRYMTLESKRFGQILISDIKSRQTTFFDLLSYATYNAENHLSETQTFIFVINVPPGVEMYAVTDYFQSDELKLGTSIDRMTNFAIGSGSIAAMQYMSKFGYNETHIEMPLREAIINAMNALKIAQQKDRFTGGFDLVVVTETNIISYRKLIEQKLLVEKDPDGLTEIILNTPL